MIDRPSRFPTNLPATVLLRADGPEAPARVSNLSKRGLLLADLATPVAREESVWIEIAGTPRRGRVAMLGRVRWADGGRAGVSIEAMLPHHRHRLAGMLRELSAG